MSDEIIHVKSDEIIEPLDKPSAFQLIKEARKKRSWDAFVRKVPIADIARTEEVSVQTVRNDIEECKNELKNLLKKKNPFDFYIEHEELIKVLQRAAMEVALEPTLLIDVDEKSGRPISTLPKDAQIKVKYFDIIIRLEQMLVDLRLDTGLMPRDAQKLVHTIEKMTNTEEKKEESSRSPEEIQESIWKLLEKARTV